MRATLFHNPTAGSEEYSRGRLMRLLADAGFVAEYRSTSREGWTTAIGDAGDLVVVAGGDGTIAKVAKGLTGRGIPLAILPTGTANNIAASFGISAPPEELVSTWDLGRTARLDVASAKGPWGKRRFIESVGLGLFAQAIALANDALRSEDIDDPTDELTRAREIVRLALQGARPQPYALSLDGELLSGAYLLVEVMSTTHLGPGVCLAPAALPGDRQFDVVLVDEVGRAALDEFLAGAGDPRAPLPVPCSRRCSTVSMEWAGEPLHIDDEVFAGSSYSSEGHASSMILRVEEAVQVLMPPATPLE